MSTQLKTPRWAKIANGVVAYLEAQVDRPPGDDWLPLDESEAVVVPPGRRAEQSGWEILADRIRPVWAIVADNPGQPVLTEAPVLEVENWQLEEELSDRGLIDALNAAINSLPAGPARNKAKARFAKKPKIRRDDPLVSGLAQVLSLSPAQVGDIFHSASLRR